MKISNCEKHFWHTNILKSVGLKQRGKVGLRAVTGPLKPFVFRWSEMHFEHFRVPNLAISTEGPLDQICYI